MSDRRPRRAVRWPWRVLQALFALLLVAAMAAAVYAWRSFPQLDGRLVLAGLSAPVQVERDAADLTHIRARTSLDAWRTIGWVHAQERGWQLEFNRRLMHGELAELLGEPALETDRLLRTLGIVRAAERQLAGLPPEVQAALQAYAEGINAFFAEASQALPPEFLLLRTRPGTWTPTDSVAWALMLALDLGGNWGHEFARLSAAQVLETPRLWQLFPPYPGEPPAARADLHALYTGLQVYRTAAPESGAAPSASTRTGGPFDSEFARFDGNPEGKGSNSWAVAGDHSTSGKPLLANDPHLGLTAPAIWYFAHLTAPAGGGQPALDVIGATLPGLPFVVLGHTPQAAWSFTNTGPDVQDLYLEQIDPADPSRFRVPDVNGQPAWAAFTTRRESIKVKGRPDVTVTVRETRHGPVISDAQASHAAVLDLKRHVLALRWTALDADNRTVAAGMKANFATSVDGLLAAYADHHSPMQNLVAADTAGRIAYKAIGRVPLRRADNDLMGLAPAPGWLPQYDWDGWIAPADTPQDLPAETAARGWIITANQRPTPPGYPFFMGQEWVVPYRHDRIAEQLAARPQHDLASMQALQQDISSAAALKLLTILKKAQARHPLAGPAQQQLARFDGRMEAGSAGALILSVWADELTRGLIEPRIGAERFRAMYGKRNFRQTVEAVMTEGDGWWCRKDPATEEPGGCAAQADAAFERALARLTRLYGSDVEAWRWGRAHPALSSHRPFGNVAGLGALFNIEVPSGGDAFTVNVGQYWSNDAKAPFANRHAASLRAIYDLADLERSVFIYQAGQSGLVWSPRYRDQADEWAQGRYRPLKRQPGPPVHALELVPK